MRRIAWGGRKPAGSWWCVRAADERGQPRWRISRHNSGLPIRIRSGGGSAASRRHSGQSVRWPVARSRSGRPAASRARLEGAAGSVWKTRSARRQSSGPVINQARRTPGGVDRHAGVAVATEPARIGQPGHPLQATDAGTRHDRGRSALPGRTQDRQPLAGVGCGEKSPPRESPPGLVEAQPQHGAGKSGRWLVSGSAGNGVGGWGGRLRGVRVAGPCRHVPAGQVDRDGKLKLRSACRGREFVRASAQGPPGRPTRGGVPGGRDRAGGRRRQ